MLEIIELAEKFSIPIIEDCSQAHGAKLDGKNATKVEKTIKLDMTILGDADYVIAFKQCAQDAERFDSEQKDKSDKSKKELDEKMRDKLAKKHKN